MRPGAAPKRAPLPPGTCQPAIQQSGENQEEEVSGLVGSHVVTLLLYGVLGAVKR